MCSGANIDVNPHGSDIEEVMKIPVIENGRKVKIEQPKPSSARRASVGQMVELKIITAT
jgi:hypothetical protein